MQKWNFRYWILVILVISVPWMSWAERPAEVSKSATVLQEPISIVSSIAAPVSTVIPTLSDSQAVIKGHVQTTEGKYLISPGDTLNISVYNAEEFNQTGLIVRPDGFVTLNPLGEMDVAGLDIDSMTKQMQEKLNVYLKQPQVSVSVAKFHPAIVYILGAVQKPGAYEIHGDMDRPDNQNAVLSRGSLTATNLISNAGGITHRANISQVVVHNNETNKRRTLDLLSLLRNGDTSQDMVLHSGDSIYVPALEGNTQMDDESYKLVTQSALAPGNMTIRVLGKVGTPGVYTLSSQSPGVNSAIASAQGYLIEANNHKVKILRMGSQGDLTQMWVDPKKNDFVLRDNDVVMVDERSMPVLGRGWDYTQRFVLPFLTMGSFANSVMDLINPGRRFPANRVRVAN